MVDQMTEAEAAEILATVGVPKPPKREKKPGRGLQRGGAKPKEAGRRYEHSFAKRFGFQRQVGSGAFGVADPMLQGDIKGEIGRLKLLFEAKSWDKRDSKGEKTVTFPAALLDKIAKEAEVLGRDPIFIYHVKGSGDEWAVVKYDWLHALIARWEQEIYDLTAQLEERMA